MPARTGREADLGAEIPVIGERMRLPRPKGSARGAAGLARGAKPPQHGPAADLSERRLRCGRSEKARGLASSRSKFRPAICGPPASTSRTAAAVPGPWRAENIRLRHWRRGVEHPHRPEGIWRNGLACPRGLRREGPAHHRQQNDNYSCHSDNLPVIRRAQYGHSWSRSHAKLE
jgi:hypothetical protein